jgi:vacuolar-type H+-ATPase subunit E/Vma4
MTRDVFKYFKHVRSLQESTTSERANELGYEYQARGVWLDPRSGKRYRAQGSQFKEIPPKEVAEKDPKSLDKFQQDAQAKKEPEKEKQEPQQPETALPQIPDGVSDDEFAAAKAKEWTGGRKVSKDRMDFLDRMAKTQVAQMNQQAAAATTPEEPPIEEPPVEEVPQEPQVTADDFPTIDDKLENDAEEAADDNDLDDDEAFETEYERFTQEAEATMRDLADRQRKMMEKKFGRFQESLANIPSSADKKSFLQSMAHAKTFEGRVNAGAGKNNLGYADIQNLEANRDRLIEGYGDGSPEAIKKFVKSVRATEVSDEFVDTSFDMLPETFKKSLKGKGQVTNDKYVSDDKAHKDIHYLGKNEDGTVKRGMASTNDRAKLMWRIYLEQGGRDAYTGLPLDIQAMDLEHVRGFNNKDGGKPGKEEWEQRENDDNMTLINSNINQKKVDLSMKDFFEREVDPHKDKSEEDFGGIEKLFDKQNEIMSVGDELSKTLLGEGGKGLDDQVNREVLIEHFIGDDTRYNELREEFRKVATDPKDKKKANGMKSKLGKTLLKATGLSRGITDPSGRRTVALQENVYRGFLLSMANAKPADRQLYMDGWAEAIAAGNEERSPKAVNRRLLELGLIDQDILDDRKSGRVFREELEYQRRMDGKKVIESLKRSLRDPL